MDILLQNMFGDSDQQVFEPNEAAFNEQLPEGSDDDKPESSSSSAEIDPIVDPITEPIVNPISEPLSESPIFNPEDEEDFGSNRDDENDNEPPNLKEDEKIETDASEEEEEDEEDSDIGSEEDQSREDVSEVDDFEEESEFQEVSQFDEVADFAEEDQIEESSNAAFNDEVEDEDEEEEDDGEMSITDIEESEEELTERLIGDYNNTLRSLEDIMEDENTIVVDEHLDSELEGDDAGDIYAMLDGEDGDIEESALEVDIFGDSDDTFDANFGESFDLEYVLT